MVLHMTVLTDDFQLVDVVSAAVWNQKDPCNTSLFIFIIVSKYTLQIETKWKTKKTNMAMDALIWHGHS